MLPTMIEVDGNWVKVESLMSKELGKVESDGSFDS
jgi:hypothetical protein